MEGMNVKGNITFLSFSRICTRLYLTMMTGVDVPHNVQDTRTKKQRLNRIGMRRIIVSVQIFTHAPHSYMCVRRALVILSLKKNLRI